jgi:hypothetical protein
VSNAAIVNRKNGSRKGPRTKSDQGSPVRMGWVPILAQHMAIPPTPYLWQGLHGIQQPKLIVYQSQPHGSGSTVIMQ